MATKTQVTDEQQTITGTITLLNQNVPNKSISASSATWRQSFMAGGIYCTIEDITESGNLYGDPQPSPPPGTDYTFIAILESAGPMPIHHHEFYYFPDGDPVTLALDYSINITGFRLNRARTSSPGAGRDSSPVFAKETHVQDTWVLEPVSWNASFGGMTDTGAEAGDTGISGITQAHIYYHQKNGITGYIYNTISMKWSDCDVDFSGMGKTVSPLRFAGDRNTISMDVVTNFLNSPGVWSTHTIDVGVPCIKDFSNFVVFDRDGDLVDTLLINGGFVADPRYPWTADCPPSGV